MINNDNEITYIERQDIDIIQLTSLYESVGWTGYINHPEKMDKLLAGSLSYLSAWKDKKLVGLIRAVGDDASILYIQDILVHPDYQRMTIGSTLVTSLLDNYAHVRQIVLLTDNTEKTKAFYSSLGFTSAEKTDTMAFIKMNWQS